MKNQTLAFKFWARPNGKIGEVLSTTSFENQVPNILIYSGLKLIIAVGVANLLMIFVEFEIFAYPVDKSDSILIALILIILIYELFANFLLIVQP